MATQSKRSIASLQINPSHRSRLMKNGYSTVADIQAISAEELSRDLGLSLEDANSIIAAAQPQSQVHDYSALGSIAPPAASQRTQIAIAGSQTAAELLKVPASATALSLGAKSIDELLDGGALKGSLLEISGVPGSGRSAAMRSIIASAIKAEHEVLVIDSRGDLPAETLRDTVSPARNSAVGSTSGLHHTRVTSLPELFACVSTLPQYCADHPGVKLIILSQLSYHIQTSAISPQARGKLLTHIKQYLTKTCGTGQVAVVATTSMAVKLIDGEGQPANFSTGTKAVLAPALGDGFSLASKTYRIVLARHPHDGRRFARLVTAPARTNQSKTTDFMIKGGFIVDMET